MKRKQEDESVATNEGISSSSGANKQRSVKKKKNALAELPPSTTKPEILTHKNRELALANRRLRKKLRLTKKELNVQEKGKEQLEAALGSSSMVMDEFIKNAVDLLNKAGLQDVDKLLAEKPDDDLEGEDDKTKTGVDSFIESVFGKERQQVFLKSVTQEVPEIAPKDEDEDWDDEEDIKDSEKIVRRLPILVERTTKRKVQIIIGLIRHITETLLKNRATPVMLNSESNTSSVRRAESKSSLLAHRVLKLEEMVRKYRTQFEDAQSERDVALRRLAGVVLNAYSKAQLKDLNDKLNEGKKGGGDASSKADGKAGGDDPNEGGSDGANKANVNGSEKENTTSANGSAPEEVKDLETLAEKRLQEINEHLESKKALIKELEELRASVSSSSSSSSTINNMMNDDNQPYPHLDPVRQIETLVAEKNSIRAQLETAKDNERTAKSQIHQAQEALFELQERTKLEANERDEKYEKKIAEKSEHITSLKLKLEEMKIEESAMEKLKQQVEEYEKLYNASNANVTRLEKRLKSLEATPFIRDMKAKIETFVNKQWPNDDGKKTMAMLETELEAARKQLETSSDKSYVDGLISELQEVSDAFAEMENQNKFLLNQEKMQTEKIARLSSNLLQMNEEMNKLKQQIKVSKQIIEEEKQTRLAHDEQYGILAERVHLLNQQREQAEQLAQANNERYQVLLSENETLRGKLNNTEASEKQYKDKVDDLKLANIRFREEKENALNTMKRAEEEKKKYRRKFERAKSMSGAELGAGNADIRAEMMENALRCPLRSEYWKDVIITRCCHMFSKKALDETYTSRNRKCPTCKVSFSKDEVKDIFLYQKNDYDE